MRNGLACLLPEGAVLTHRFRFPAVPSGGGFVV
jgi:hypothetical protein